MKAAILTHIGAPLVIYDLIHTGASRMGQVLVRIRQSGICGAQLAEIRGEKGNAKYLPHLLGHEASGEVLAIGPGVTRVRVGDKVVCHWRKADGCEAASPQYELANGLRGSIGGGPIATFATEAIISENRLTPVPNDTPDDLCALLGCGLSTALGTMENEANLKMGETVLIIGCGGLGANLILAAKLRCASAVVVVDINDKRQLARDLGANYFESVSGMKRQLLPLVDPEFDVIIDTTGSPSAIHDALPLLSGGGRFIMVGQPKPGASVEIPNARSLFDGEGKTIMATQGGRFRPDADIPRYVAMHRAGLLNISGLVTHRVSLDEINQGLDLVRSGQAGRVMVHNV